jgi:uncharacterized protein DUF6925
MASAFDLIVDQLADPDARWSLGSFGAVAAFMRDSDEPAEITQNEQAVSVVTPRGAIRLEARESLRAMAFETVTTQSWSQRVALCLPQDQAAMGGRTVLTELGPDTRALRPRDRGALLFDLGLGAIQVDGCIRTSDPALIEALRKHLRRPLFAAGNPVMELILRHSPHGVFATRIGRIEIYQATPEGDGVTLGPQSHVLPQLLASKRAHAASEPIPRGWIACGHLHTTHPLHDLYGRARPFDAALYMAFQRMLSRYGDAEHMRLKRNVTKGVIGGLAPSAIAIPDDRFARATITIALRQLKASEGTSSNLTAWFAAHDRGPDPDEVALEGR